MTGRPLSLVAERAVRFLRKQTECVDSRRLARELLATEAKDEQAARRVLETAFAGDSRLDYSVGSGWELTDGSGGAGASIDMVGPPPDAEIEPDPDRTLIFLRGGRPDPAEPYRLDAVSVIRLQGEEVLTACGGDTVPGPPGNRLRRAVLETLDGAVPVIHDPPGSLRAFEAWLEEPLEYPVSLREVGRDRLGLPARHELSDMAARLEMLYREVDDPLEQADTLDACLHALRHPGESLQALRAAGNGGQPLDWTRYSFNREFLRRIPRVPGTYQFLDEDGKLIYVGKAKNLHDRLASYFSAEGRRSARVRRLLDALHSIEFSHSGSALEAALREAEMIAERNPEKNVQRKVAARARRGSRLTSILILEPAEAPTVLRAYLIRNGRLLDRIGIGPRGGGLKRIERVLEDRFFSCPSGPTPIDDGPDLDVELIVRWLAENRDRVVAFDPTDLQSTQDVIDRLRWFLEQGTPFDSDGSPILTR